MEEGGKALQDAGVVRISRDDIPATVELIAFLTGIPKKELITLGSVGKQATSGDIDIAIDAAKYDPQEIHQRVLNVLGGEETGRYNDGTKIGSYAVPIAGNIEKGLVQVDLMYVPNTKWAQFAYHSPGEKSRFKGAIRGILLAAAAASLDEPGKDAFVYNEESGDLIARTGRGFNPNLGLKRMNQLRGKSKRTGGWLKTMKNVTPEEIKSAFPDLKFDGSNLIIDNPKEAVQVMFGVGVTPKDVDSAEEILDLAKRTFPRGRYERFINQASKRATPLINKGIDLPEELKDVNV